MPREGSQGKLAVCPFGAEPMYERFNDPYENPIDNPHGLYNRSDVLNSELMSRAAAFYPQNADESMEVLCDNGLIRLVNIRVFMSLQLMFTKLTRDFYQSLMLEHKDAMMKKEAEWLTKMENE